MEAAADVYDPDLAILVGVEPPDATGPPSPDRGDRLSKVFRKAD